MLMLFFLFAALPAMASDTDGTIDATSRYAWSESAGWIDFGTSAGNVHITDSALSGYAWNDNIGWISLNCSNDSSCGTLDYKIANDGNGKLSGYAWSETAGWIDFAPAGGGVTVDASGNFSGYAWNDNIGWIVFDCATTSSCGTADYKIATDWRPQSARTSPTVPPAPLGSISSGGGMTSGGSAYQSWLSLLGLAPSGASSSVSIPAKIVEAVPKAIVAVVPKVWSAVTGLFGVGTKNEPAAPIAAPPVAQKAPLALSGIWNLLPEKPLAAFALAPLPPEITALAAKLPAFGKVLSSLGVNKMTDLDKLRNAGLIVPSLASSLGANAGNVPTGIVFAQTGAGLVNLAATLSISDSGAVSQKIETVANHPIKLTVRPDGPANGVTGYIAFLKAADRTAAEIPVNSMAAAAILASPFASSPAPAKPVSFEDKMILSSFTYAGPDKDGVYTATIQAPQVEGEYEIINMISYKDAKQGTREIRLIAVIDPEGYVYETLGGLEARVPRATVTIWKEKADNASTSGADGNGSTVWNARDFNQENPQTTDKTGKYSFLVPEGRYYLTVAASGYAPYRSDDMEVTENNGIHFNIELTRSGSWVYGLLDWRSALVMVFAAALAVNFYNDRRLMKKLLAKKDY
jgi:hypothetical protein